MAHLGGQGAFVRRRLVGQHGQGGLQGMGQIARMGAGAADNGGLVVQQGIDFVGQGLDFTGKGAVQPSRPAGPDIAQGLSDPGHTEMLQRLTGSPEVGMLMAAEKTNFGAPL